ncbi:MAG: cytochrome-c oxidase, cbb3-type subunit III [Geminicoccaceae bacterium]|nr:MAG: cytochrome-c oxidase, cbb3-type subunit III [Geminicoccaceae bacterium]
MPTKIEKDEVTGVETTGHEWDGIRELNNPLPKWWVYTFYVSVAYAVIWWVLFPAIPFGPSATGGLTGSETRDRVLAEIERVEAERATVRQRLVGAELSYIQDDPTLFTYALTGGRIAFGDNCAPCHGVGGTGQLSYPVLADDDWIWGGTIEDIQHTIQWGVRWPDFEFDTRFAMMPAFGADGILTREEVDQVVDFVLAMSGRADEADPDLIEAGAEVYEWNCASCHGDGGEGMHVMGAPALNNQIWLFGGEREQIWQQIWNPRHGVMPGFAERLDEATIKMLAVYVHALGGGQ